MQKLHDHRLQSKTIRLTTAAVLAIVIGVLLLVITMGSNNVVVGAQSTIFDRITVIPHDDTSMKITWEANHEDNNIQYYNIEYRSNNTQWQSINEIATTTDMYIIDGLSENTLYYVRMHAFYTNDESDNNIRSKSSDIMKLLLSKPNIIQIDNIVPYANKFAVFLDIGPQNDIYIENYTVEYEYAPDNPIDNWSDLADNMSIVVDDVAHLDDGVVVLIDPELNVLSDIYNIRAYATNNIGSSPFSDTEVIRLAVPPEPSKVVLDNKQISWDYPLDHELYNITHYTIQWKLSNAQRFNLNNQKRIEYAIPHPIVLPLSQLSLDLANEYDIEVYAHNNVGHSVVAIPSYSIPEAPLNLNATIDNGIVLRWDEPYNGGSAITEYVIELRPKTGVAFDKASDLLGNTIIWSPDINIAKIVNIGNNLCDKSYCFDDNEIYEIRIYAVNELLDENTTPNYATVELYLPRDLKITAPDAPGNFEAFVQSNYAVQLVWDAPYNGGAAIAYYVAQVQIDNQWQSLRDKDNNKIRIDSSANTLLFYNLVEYSDRTNSYNIRIAATNQSDDVLNYASTTVRVIAKKTNPTPAPSPAPAPSPDPTQAPDPTPAPVATPTPPITAPPATSTPILNSNSTTGLQLSSVYSNENTSLRLNINSLSADIVNLLNTRGSAIELFIDGNFQIPLNINTKDVYVVVSPPHVTNEYSSRIQVDDIDIIKSQYYYQQNIADYSIRIQMPDLCTTDNSICNKFNAPAVGNDLILVFDKNANIKTPLVAGQYRIGYKILNNIMEPGVYDNTVIKPTTKVLDQDGLIQINPYISTNKTEAGRNEMIVISGKGFEPNTQIEIFTMSNDSILECKTIVEQGVALNNTTALNSTANIDFKMLKSRFESNDNNYVCIVNYQLPFKFYSNVLKIQFMPSIRFKDEQLRSGGTVVLTAIDFEEPLDQIIINGKYKWSANQSNNDFKVARSGDEYQFIIPQGLRGNISIVVSSGNVTIKKSLGLINPVLLLGKTDLILNQSILIKGENFSPNSYINIDNIQINDVNIPINNSDIQNNCIDGIKRCITTDKNGNFTFNARIWGDDIALEYGKQSLEIIDVNNNKGNININILEPYIDIMPKQPSHGDTLTVYGYNWPVSTYDDTHIIELSFNRDLYSIKTNHDGKFEQDIKLLYLSDSDTKYTIEARLRSSKDIKSKYEFNIVGSTNSITPTSAAPGEYLVFRIQGVARFYPVEDVIIGNKSTVFNKAVTDKNGDVVIEKILVPDMDPGRYPVKAIINKITRTSYIDVLPLADSKSDTAIDIAQGLHTVIDKITSLFYFDNDQKEWLFYSTNPAILPYNTLTTLIDDEIYWILVSEEVKNVTLNDQLRNMTCKDEVCWNILIW